MMRRSPHALARCFTCRRRRRLRNLYIQAYYDATYYRCRAACRRKRAVRAAATKPEAAAKGGGE
jgi:hypothetical protein